ncbi:hypothetical protein C1645_80278 [Glomus cerebriforme]|uniref:HMG box domain-containing protein n=1 Tax=Glomus cerebriforme TaxID=658196 RepID=A0A397T280_9GLOM|nr:hypothetical protein C1645_80278 [Glomus cerebriforme]
MELKPKLSEINKPENQLYEDLQPESFQVVDNCELHMNLGELLSPSSLKSKTRKQSPFNIYRRNVAARRLSRKNYISRTKYTTDAKDNEMWKNESNEVKNFYRMLATESTKLYERIRFNFQTYKKYTFYNTFSENFDTSTSNSKNVHSIESVSNSIQPFQLFQSYQQQSPQFFQLEQPELQLSQLHYQYSPLINIFNSEIPQSYFQNFTIDPDFYVYY